MAYFTYLDVKICKIGVTTYDLYFIVPSFGECSDIIAGVKNLFYNSWSHGCSSFCCRIMHLATYTDFKILYNSHYFKAGARSLQTDICYSAGQDLSNNVLISCIGPSCNVLLSWTQVSRPIVYDSPLKVQCIK